MAEESISLSDAEYRFLKALVDEGVEFLVVGLSAALFQGVPAVTQDIDLWVKDLGNSNFLAAVKKAGAIYIPPAVAGENPPMLGGSDFRGIDLVTTCHGLSSIKEELKNALRVKLRDIELYILPLERIILSKETTNREKDRATLPMLKAALSARQK